MADPYEAEVSAETLDIEQRLRDMGYAQLPSLLKSQGDFEFSPESIEAVVEQARQHLLHQQSVELSGARILAAIGEAAVKAQAFDTIAELVRRSN